MNEAVKTLFFEDNILSYADACICVYEQLDVLRNENYKRLIIPSRGAYPFYNGARQSLHVLCNSYFEIMRWQMHFEETFMPFTSDWGNAKTSFTSNEVRRFWVRVLADSIRNEKTPYSEFYNLLVDVAGKNLTINVDQLKLTKYYTKKVIDDDKFIFIDTAKSGRAISEIIDAFYDFGITDFYVILIVDNNGYSLDARYKSIIEREKQRGKLKQINVANIFSEDASPLLNTGISSVVFPSLIEAVINEVAEFRNNNIAGAGVWFIDSASHLRKSNSNLNAVRAIIAQYIYTGINYRLNDIPKWFSDQIEHNNAMIIECLGSFNLFDPSFTKTIVYDRILSVNTNFSDDVDVSSSHVIRVNLDTSIIKSISNIISKY